ncbi:MAG: hypothetical protein ABL897_00260 [Hyphomicrobium sp.]
MLIELHRRAHAVSHSQIDLLVKGAELAEMEVGGTLVSFAPGHIKVATAWDGDGLEPYVEIIVTGFALVPAPGIDGLVALASGRLDVDKAGIEVGNFITADLMNVAIPAGHYAVTIFADTVTPMTARRVHFHFRSLSGQPQE